MHLNYNIYLESCFKKVAIIPVSFHEFTNFQYSPNSLNTLIKDKNSPAISRYNRMTFVIN